MLNSGMDYLRLPPRGFLGCFAAPLLAAWVVCASALPDEGVAVRIFSLCDDGGRGWVEYARAQGLFDRVSPLTGMVDYSDEVVRVSVTRTPNGTRATIAPFTRSESRCCGDMPVHFDLSPERYARSYRPTELDEVMMVFGADHPHRLLHFDVAPDVPWQDVLTIFEVAQRNGNSFTSSCPGS